MSNIIPKGSDASQHLLSSVEAVFDMSAEQRRTVEALVDAATDQNQPSWTYAEFYRMAGLESCKLSRQPLEQVGYFDEGETPDGGWCDGTGLQIRWTREQESDGQLDGCLPVTVLYAVRHRLQLLESAGCLVNEEALRRINQAIDAFEAEVIENFKRNGCAE